MSKGIRRVQATKLCPFSSTILGEFLCDIQFLTFQNSHQTSTVKGIMKLALFTANTLLFVLASFSDPVTAVCGPNEMAVGYRSAGGHYGVRLILPFPLYTSTNMLNGSNTPKCSPKCAIMLVAM